MRFRAAILVTVTLLTIAAGAVLADPVGRHLQISQLTGYTFFDDNRNHVTGTQLRDVIHFDARIGYSWNSHLTFEAGAGFTPTQEDEPGGENMDFTQFSLGALWTPTRMGSLWPYVLVGGAVSRLDPTSGGNGDTQGNAAIGVGAQYWLNDVVGLRIEASDLVWLPKDSPTDFESHSYTVEGGLTFGILGRPRDTDADGVPDRIDTCEKTPLGARVDPKGCPTDADRDGVLDGLDACDGTPSGCRVDPRGCPSDVDGDGVCDGVDTCPDTPKGALVSTQGCTSDSDKDGVPDGLDQCEGSRAGCKVDERGCPSDKDGDGICDGLDTCPDTSPNLRVDKDGCPIEVSERETEMLNTGMIRIQNIEFETGKANLTPGSTAQLDIVGQVLTKWPDLRIEIGGHTDSRGSTSFNQKLSEQRVKSVLDYMLWKFPQLKPEQYTARGYGESKPVVPNNSPEAMARNRRVEFVVLNKDVLKREVEHRRLIEK